jgi:threonyl-tRNA synthetase
MKHGDGAFYGPKIDVTVTDALQAETEGVSICTFVLISKYFCTSK